MHLITMAHLGEAQGVIELFKLKRLAPHLFEGEDISLVITGEGPFEALAKTSYQLGKRTFSQVLNLGIAGSLDAQFAVGEIYPVRMHYLMIENKPQFKSFQGHSEGLDCLTTMERILVPEKATPLRGLGKLIDRESWGVAMACKNAGINFHSYKIISDQAGTLGACELVKESATVFSHHLAQHLKTLLADPQEVKKEALELEGFHLTFTTQHKVQELLQKLSIKKDLPLKGLLPTLPLEKITTNCQQPKERTRLLIQFLEDELDPVRKLMLTRIAQWKSPWEKERINLEVDPLWEEARVKISFAVEDENELKEKLSALNNLSLRPYQQLLQGDFHVE
jgi:hypothetical protein